MPLHAHTCPFQTQRLLPIYLVNEMSAAEQSGASNRDPLERPNVVPKADADLSQPLCPTEATAMRQSGFHSNFWKA